MYKRQEKEAIDTIRSLKSSVEAERGEADGFERDGDLAKAAEIRYGRVPVSYTHLGRYGAPGGG